MTTKEKLLKIRISTGLDELLEELVERGLILNKSQFIRDLIYTSPEVKRFAHRHLDVFELDYQFKAEKARHLLNYRLPMKVEDVRSFYQPKRLIFEDPEYLNDYMDFLTAYPQAKLGPQVIQEFDYKKDRLEALERKVMSDTFKGYLSDSEILYFCFHILQFSLAIAYREHRKRLCPDDFPLELEDEEFFIPWNLFRENMIDNWDCDIDFFRDEDYAYTYPMHTILQPLIDLIVEDETFVRLKEGVNGYYSLDEEGFNIDILANFCVKEAEEDDEEDELL